MKNKNTTKKWLLIKITVYYIYYQNIYLSFESYFDSIFSMS